MKIICKALVMEYCLSKIRDLNGDEREDFLSLIFLLFCMRMRVCVFNHFVHVSTFTLPHVLFKVITFIIYFILILLLPILLKKWGLKIQKI